jgi:hypothetical protein
LIAVEILEEEKIKIRLPSISSLLKPKIKSGIKRIKKQFKKNKFKNKTNRKNNQNGLKDQDNIENQGLIDELIRISPLRQKKEDENEEYEDLKNLENLEDY